VRQRGTLPQADELGVCPEPVGAEDVVTDVELGDSGTDGFDHARQLDAEYPPPRPTETEQEAPEDWTGYAKVGIGLGDGRGADPDEDFVVLGRGPLDVLDAENLGRAVPVLDNGFHAFTPFRGRPRPTNHPRIAMPTATSASQTMAGP
jgi:hypothetical protein